MTPALSYTQISLYKSCPLCYKLQYIDGLKQKDKWYFSFGSTLHGCVEFFFKAKLPGFPGLPELLKYYDRNWLPGGWTLPEEEAKYKKYRREILEDFWHIHSANFKVPLAVERLFQVYVEGVRLRGYIDRIDKLDSGGLALLDYKTDREFFTRDYVENHLQLTLYQLAAEKTWDMPIERLTLYHLRSNTPCSCGPRERKQLEYARRIVLEVAEGIASKRFPATESPSCPCDFPEHCPYYQHQYLKEAVRLSSDEELPIESIVEQYGLLQEQARQIEAQIDELKQRIVEFCQEKGLNRVFGRGHAVTYKLVDRTGYKEDEVRSLLEPEGLWERVIGLNSPKVNEILKSPEIPEEIRSRLMALRQVISSYPKLWVRKLDQHGEEVA
ncbi:PD-(D/E)XK nuclease family protein [Chloroflexota bacterium]